MDPTKLDRYYSPEFRQKARFAFDGLYSQYKQINRMMAVAYIAKRILIACFVGALGNRAVLQLVLIFSVCAIHTYLTFVVMPFELKGDNQVNSL